MLDSPRGDLSTSIPTRFPAVTEQVEGKKAKKARKRAEMARGLAALGADLARLDLALRRLDDRVGDLHSVQLAHEEETAASASKVLTLTERLDRASQDTVAAREREEGLRSAVEQLQGAVDALRAEAAVITDSLAAIAVQPDRDTALFVLEDRIEAAEELISGLQSNLDAAQPDPQLGADLRQVLSQLEPLRRQFAEGLQGQSERLSMVEQRIGEGMQALKAAIPDQERWEETHRALRADVDQRLDTVAHDLAATQEQARHGEREWTERRLLGITRRVGAGLGVLGLLALVLFAADWWRTEQRFEVVSARIAEGTNAKGAARGSVVTPPVDTMGPDSVLGRLTATLQLAQAQNDRLAERLVALQEAPPTAAGAEVDTRIRRLEQTQTDLQRSAEQSAQLAATLNARLEAVAKAQPAAASQKPSAADPTESESTPPAQMAASNAGTADKSAPPHTVSAATDKTQPVVLGETRYTVQLIGFRSKASIAPFARRFGVLDQARYMLSKYQGRDWYVVLVGDYPTQAEGLAAAKQLPEELRALKPWVRPLRAGSRLFPVE
jgi:uncharacterized phage infection (PIP) family protein YhgE